jgi:hypothetical protein
MSTAATMTPGTDLATSPGMPTALRHPFGFQPRAARQDAPTGDPIVMPLSLALSLSVAYAVVAFGPVAVAHLRAACLAAGMLDWTPGEWATFAGTVLAVGSAATLGLKRLVNWFTKLVVDRYAELLVKIEANRKATVEVGQQVKTGTAAAVTQAAAQAATQAVTQTTAEAVAPAVKQALNDSAIPTSDAQLDVWADKLAQKVEARLRDRGSPPPPTA